MSIMVSNPLVSVIIPLYNKGPFISRAIDSVLAQTLEEFELIVVGGNSTDGGESIVLDYTDSRIRFVQETGCGVSAARNQGVSIARADIVSFLDADDVWMPDFLNTIMSLKQKWPDAGMYSTAWISHYPDGREIPSKCYGISDNWEGFIPSVFRCAAIDWEFPGRTSTIAVPKHVFNSVGGFREDSVLGEDLDLWGKIALFYDNVHSSRPMAYYMHDDEMATTRNLSLLILDKFPFQKTVDELLEKGVIDSESIGGDLELYLERLKIEVAKGHIVIKDYNKAREILKSIHRREIKRIKYMVLLRSYYPVFLLPVGRLILTKLKHILNLNDHIF